MSSILKISNLNYKSIFKDLNVTLEKNTINLLTGSNKCGKTTFIRILSGEIEFPNTCFYRNKDITKMKSLEFSNTFSSIIFNGNFSFVFNTLEEEIISKLDKTNLSISERKMKYRNLLKIFNLKEEVNENVNNLSFFEKIKALILLNLLHTPSVLLLDNLVDDLSDDEVLEIINILKKIGGMTVIITSNSINVAPFFDNVYVIEKGTLLLSGNPLDVLKEDSTLNKIGLNLPFVVDLSIKLKYYDLVDNIELDVNRMVNKLWK